MGVRDGSALADQGRAAQDDRGAKIVYQPIGIGMKQGEPALLAKINQTLLAMDEAGQINELWNRWLGPETEYKMTRTDKIVPLAELKFTPIP